MSAVCLIGQVIEFVQYGVRCLVIARAGSKYLLEDEHMNRRWVGERFLLESDTEVV
jgi:hypothetical protein